MHNTNPLSVRVTDEVTDVSDVDWDDVIKRMKSVSAEYPAIPLRIGTAEDEKTRKRKEIEKTEQPQG